MKACSLCSLRWIWKKESKIKKHSQPVVDMFIGLFNQSKPGLRSGFRRTTGSPSCICPRHTVVISGGTTSLFITHLDHETLVRIRITVILITGLSVSFGTFYVLSFSKMWILSVVLRWFSDVLWFVQNIFIDVFHLLNCCLSFWFSIKRTGAIERQICVCTIYSW